MSATGLRGAKMAEGLIEGLTLFARLMNCFNKLRIYEDHKSRLPRQKRAAIEALRLILGFLIIASTVAILPFIAAIQ